jgi:hypothetical protein
MFFLPTLWAWDSASSTIPILIGYTPSPQFPVLSNSTLQFLPGETIWVRPFGQSVSLADPSGKSIPLSPSANDTNLFSYSFKNSDPPGTWSLTSAQSTAKIVLVDTSTESTLLATLRYQFLNRDIEISSGTRTQGVESPLFLSPGTNNSYIPGELVNLTSSIPQSVNQNVNISMEYPTPIVLTQTGGPITEILSYNSTVEIATVPSKNATFFIPQLHQVGNRGLVPLRYGSIQFIVTLADGTVLPQAISAYVLPQAIRGFVSSTITIPEKDFGNASTFSIAGINYTQNSVVVKSYTVPLVNFSVFETSHKMFMGDYTLNFSNQSNVATETVRNNTYTIIPAFENILIPSQPLMSFSVLLNLSVFNFRVLTNLRVNVSLPQNFVLDIGLRRLVVSSTLTPGGQPTNSNFTLTSSVGMYKASWSNRTLLLPAGIYNITANHNGNLESKIIDLKSDSSVNFSFQSPTSPYLTGAFLFAGFEIGGLLYLIFIRTRRTIR